MAHPANLEGTIAALAEEVKLLRQAQGKKPLSDHVATWAPLVTVLVGILAIVLPLMGIDGRLTSLEQKVDAGFLRLGEGLKQVELQVARLDAKTSSAPQTAPLQQPASPPR